MTTVVCLGVACGEDCVFRLACDEDRVFSVACDDDCVFRCRL